LEDFLLDEQTNFKVLLFGVEPREETLGASVALGDILNASKMRGNAEKYRTQMKYRTCPGFH
jgi:hypothetical protein